ncbi:hypothetical protein DFJ73DRAFT_774384 [Zopfochytrium polystomum]|nr:hypothetical protein DFJ73DRAFT_774384 [Zopfochytrium polystomum]
MPSPHADNGGATKRPLSPHTPGALLHPASIAFILAFPLGIVFGMLMMDWPCKADFCLESFHAIAKRNSRIALGVFYAWCLAAVAVALAARALPRLRFALLRPLNNSSFTLGEALFHLWILALFFFNLGFFTVHTEELLNSPAYVARKLVPARRAAFFWAQMTGKLTDVTLGLTLLFTAKSSGFQTLLGVSFDRLARVHRWVGMLFIAAVAAHGALYIGFTAQYRTAEDLLSVLFYGSQRSATHDHPLGWGEGNWMVTMGTYSAILLFPVAALSIPSVVRRRNFPLFRLAHWLVFPMMLFAWLHAASDFYYCIPGLVIYLADTALRLRAAWGATTQDKALRVRSVVFEPTGHVRVDFDWPAGGGAAAAADSAGRWALLHFPDVAPLEWHPYSLAQGAGSVATVFFRDPSAAAAAAAAAGKPRRRRNAFESRLAAALAGGGGGSPDKTNGGGGDQPPPPLRVAVHGPFGGPTGLAPLAGLRALAVVVAGTGAAPGFGLARRAAAGSVGGDGGVLLAWSVRVPGGAGAAAKVSLVRECARAGVKVVVYETGGAAAAAAADPEAGAATSAGAGEGEGDLDDGVVVHRGARMDPTAVLRAHFAAAAGAGAGKEGPVGVFVCGPAGFRAAVRRAAGALGAEGMDVRLCEEGFEL